MRNLIFLCLLFPVLCSASLTSAEVGKNFFATQNYKNFQAPHIINGKEAEKGQFPWQVAIFENRNNERNFICGGALISDRWILTAAHCMIGGRPKDFTLSLGSNDLDDPNRVLVNPAQIIVHEKFHDSGRYGSDVAVIKLPKPVKFTQNIKKIDIVTNQMKVGTIATVSGWGTNTSYGDVVKHLNYVSLISISHDQCQKVYDEVNVQLPNGTFCVEQTAAIVQSICYGDSGSPLVIYENHGKGLHVGIASFLTGIDNVCESGKPVVFTNTYDHRQWIKEKTGI